MTGQWQNSNFYQPIEQIDRIPDFDPRTGDHLWCITTMYQWGGPDIEQTTLDRENLLCIAGPGCYHCEEPYTQQLAKRRCKGKP